MAVATQGFIGVEKVMRQLNKEIAKLKVKSMKGLIESAILIRRDMDMTPPLIPVQFGNLRASSFIVTAKATVNTGGNFKNAPGMGSRHKKVISNAISKARRFPGPVVIMGFSANYASAVETMNKKHAWNRPSSGPRFFESALRRNRGLIIKTIVKSV